MSLTPYTKVIHVSANASDLGALSLRFESQFGAARDETGYLSREVC